MVGVPGRSGGQNRKTTAEHKLSGGYREDRHGGRVDGVGPVGWPEKPDGLMNVQSELWDDVVEALPAAALGKIDTHCLRDLVRWYGVYCKCMKRLEEDVTDRQAMLSAEKSWTSFSRLAMDYGLTPNARARLKVPVQRTEDEEDPFVALLERFANSRNNGSRTRAITGSVAE